MIYPERCIGLIGRIIGHDFLERSPADKQIICCRCGLVLPVEVDVTLELALAQELTRLKIAEKESYDAEYRARVTERF